MKAHPPRIVFMDNIRSLMVILVLVFHSGASYGTGAAFWPFHEKNPSGIIDFFMFLCDVFFMSILFFIAGYFALPDLLHKGLSGFIKGRLKRLGLPWCIITAAVLPVLDYIHYVFNHIQQALPPAGFIEYWLLSMKKLSELHIGWIDMSSYYYMTDNFYQRYAWFISLLLFFCSIFGLIHTFKNHLIKQKLMSRDSNQNILKILFIYTLVMIVLFGGIRFKLYTEFMDNGWFSLGNILQFQCGKIALYGCFFGLGVRAYSGKWFTENHRFWKARVWAIICFCLFVLNMLVLKNLSSHLSSLKDSLFIAKIAFCALYPLWALSFWGLFVSIGYKYWNRPTQFNIRLAANSYNMYLVHYIIPFTFPLLLSKIALPVFIKFGIVSIVTLVFSYALSAFIINPLVFCPKHKAIKILTTKAHKAHKV